MTGHRILPNPAAAALAVQKAVKEIIAEYLQNKKPSSPVFILSSLAEGADRIATRELLRHPNSELHAILPLEIDDYMTDFKSADSQKEFADLIALAGKTVILPSQKDRSRAYEAAGHHVVDTCDLLIAVWDGQPARGRGGTADIVAYARRKNRPIVWIHSEHPGQIIREPIPPRCKVDWAPIEEERLRRHEVEEKQKLESTLEKSLALAAGNTTPEAAALLKERLRRILEYFIPTYVKADQSAIFYQARHRNATRAVFLLAASAVIIVSAQFIFHLPHLLVLGEVLAIATILTLFYWSNWKGWHRHWVDCRLLAEWIRCGIFVDFLRDDDSDQEGRQWTSEWIINSWCIDHFQDLRMHQQKLKALTEDSLPVLKDFFRTAWLNDQRVFHERTAAREIKRHNRISRASEACFWMTFIAAILHLLPHSLYPGLHAYHQSIARILTFLVIALPAAGSAFAGLRSHFQYKKLSRRSGMMAFRLEKLDHQLDRMNSLEELKGKVLTAESLMLHENTDWHVTIGSNPPEKLA
ncbi:MAG: hypothetical protein KJ970_04025 [Candidatus Eisenbacteria bacterium]|uniref:SMODS and SLOG-associating 2TM effector domain-containing protein n=1 Tax=Eiseniibacteriota bacterium TaxID=2212470 RepID=A0A948W5Y8_UNCEI|nr:hypothetical protein [Candidatus Eisenbacteria bacterium]